MASKVRSWLKVRFITGFFVTVPVIATAWLLWVFWNSIDDFFSPGYERIIGYRVPGLGKGSGKPGRGDPVNRASAVTNIFAAGSVLLPATWTSWRDEYIEELSSFPYGEHNDQVVATVQLLEYVYPTEARGMPPEVTVDLPWW